MRWVNLPPPPPVPLPLCAKVCWYALAKERGRLHSPRMVQQMKGSLCFLQSRRRTKNSTGNIGDDAVMQIKSELWGGEFVDLQEDEIIPDRAVV